MRCARMVFCMIGAACMHGDPRKDEAPAGGRGFGTCCRRGSTRKERRRCRRWTWSFAGSSRPALRRSTGRRSGGPRSGATPFRGNRMLVVLQAGSTSASAPQTQGCRPSRDPRRRRRLGADRRSRSLGHDGLPKDEPTASTPANGGEIVFCDRIDGSVLAPPILAGGHRGCPAKPRTVILLRLRGVVFVHKHDSGTGPPPAFPPTPG